jgi:HAD superfamily hydrolase (TIGR01509 family)
MIKAIVFDFDGLIFDTETPEFASFQEIFQEHGLELPLDIWSQWVGTDASKFNPYDFLEKQFGNPINREEIRQLRRGKYDVLIRNQSIRAGVVEYLFHAKKLGLAIGLASSSTRQWVTKHLEELNIVEYFDCIRVREDVQKVKPDPALYLQVLEHFNVDPLHSIAFEDSPNGALAAKRAGMNCVIVPNDITKSLKFCDIDLRLESMDHMSLEQIIKTITEIRK